MALESIVAVATFLLSLEIGLVQGFDSSKVCSVNTLAVYRMSLKTHWTEELFPRDYPKFRPPAQWSKVFGQTHNHKHSIFRLGKVSSGKLRKLAERGDLYKLSQLESKNSIFDQFTSPSILKGEGETVQDFLTIGNYSKMSVVCKIIPSPDWFIGIDSLELCDGDQWIEDFEISVDPLDAGTQGGFTFTAPRWRLQVPEPILMITSQHPSHRAASFHYPKLEKLPSIATFRIEKIKEYTLDEEFPSTQCNDSNILNFEENNETLYENNIFSNCSDSMNSTRLLNETEKVVSDVLENFKKNDKYFPKLFRPKIDYSDSRKSDSYTSGNLLKSKLPKREKTKTSYFSW